MDSSAKQPADAKFRSHGATAEDLLKSQTVGLVNLSDFRKRRAEAQDIKDREASSSGRGTDVEDAGQGSDSSVVSSIPKKKKKASAARSKLSFAADDDDDGDNLANVSTKTSRSATPADAGPAGDESGKAGKPRRLGANSSVLAPKALTKAMRAKEAEEREVLRKNFLLMQEAVKTAEFLIPFVFFDGANADGGTCRVKKGDRVWLFLDKARKVGSDKSQAGGMDRGTASRREWARMSVDDLMMVRGDIILPHHYEFYYFIANKTKGHASRFLFPYSTQVSLQQLADEKDVQQNPSKSQTPQKSADDGSLEGGSEEPTFTKVVDRRWYERNKHIWPASVWEEFDPTKDYTTTQRKDAQGNSFFF